MASPNYFNNLPDIDYAYKVNRSGQTSHLKIKDYFHLMTTRDDIFKKETLFKTHTIIDGMRPEQISYEEYGDEKYYWIILQVNEITDYYNQWPLSQYELDEHLDKKYGSKLNDIRHYEMPTVKDEEGRVLLKGGQVVHEDYVYEYQPNPLNLFFESARPYAVTNIEYEYQQNDMKSEIQLLRKQLLYKYENEIQFAADRINPGSLSSEIDIAEYYN